MEEDGAPATPAASPPTPGDAMEIDDHEFQQASLFNSADLSGKDRQARVERARAAFLSGQEPERRKWAEEAAKLAVEIQDRVLSLVVNDCDQADRRLVEASARGATPHEDSQVWTPWMEVQGKAFRLFTLARSLQRAVPCVGLVKTFFSELCQALAAHHLRVGQSASMYLELLKVAWVRYCFVAQTMEELLRQQGTKEDGGFVLREYALQCWQARVLSADGAQTVVRQSLQVGHAERIGQLTAGGGPLWGVRHIYEFARPVYDDLVNEHVADVARCFARHPDLIESESPAWLHRQIQLVLREVEHCRQRFLGLKAYQGTLRAICDSFVIPLLRVTGARMKDSPEGVALPEQRAVFDLAKKWDRWWVCCWGELPKDVVRQEDRDLLEREDAATAFGVVHKLQPVQVNSPSTSQLDLAASVLQKHCCCNAVCTTLQEFRDAEATLACLLKTDRPQEAQDMQMAIAISRVALATKQGGTKANEPISENRAIAMLFSAQRRKAGRNSSGGSSSPSGRGGGHDSDDEDRDRMVYILRRAFQRADERTLMQVRHHILRRHREYMQMADRRARERQQLRRSPPPSMPPFWRGLTGLGSVLMRIIGRGGDPDADPDPFIDMPGSPGGRMGPIDMMELDALMAGLDGWEYGHPRERMREWRMIRDVIRHAERDAAARRRRARWSDSDSDGSWSRPGPGRRRRSRSRPRSPSSSDRPSFESLPRGLPDSSDGGGGSSEEDLRIPDCDDEKAVYLNHMVMLQIMLRSRGASSDVRSLFEDFEQLAWHMWCTLSKLNPEDAWVEHKVRTAVDRVSFLLPPDVTGDAWMATDHLMAHVRPPAIARVHLEPGARYRGTVKLFVSDKNFGFIECEELRQLYKRDVWVHGEQLISLAVHGPLYAQSGRLVEFSIRLGGEGFPQAYNVTTVQLAYERQEGSLFRAAANAAVLSSMPWLAQLQATQLPPAPQPQLLPTGPPPQQSPHHHHHHHHQYLHQQPQQQQEQHQQQQQVQQLLQGHHHHHHHQHHQQQLPTMQPRTSWRHHPYPDEQQSFGPTGSDSGGHWGGKGGQPFGGGADRGGRAGEGGQHSSGGYSAGKGRGRGAGIHPPLPGQLGEGDLHRQWPSGSSGAENLLGNIARCIMGGMTGIPDSRGCLDLEEVVGGLASVVNVHVMAHFVRAFIPATGRSGRWRAYFLLVVESMRTRVRRLADYIKDKPLSLRRWVSSLVEKAGQLLEAFAAEPECRIIRRGLRSALHALDALRPPRKPVLDDEEIEMVASWLIPVEPPGAQDARRIARQCRQAIYSSLGALSLQQHLAMSFEHQVVRAGKAACSVLQPDQPRTQKEFVDKMTAFVTHFESIINTGLDGSFYFHRILSRTVDSLLSESESHLRPLCSCLHQALISKSTQDELEGGAVPASVLGALQLAGHVRDKDLFARLHQAFLARRIASGICSPAAETTVLRELTQRGYSCRFLQETLSHVVASGELFSSFAHAGGTAVGTGAYPEMTVPGPSQATGSVTAPLPPDWQPSHIQLRGYVLPSTHWPASMVPAVTAASLRREASGDAVCYGYLPLPLSAAALSFASFYRRRHEGRRLCFLPNYGSVQLVLTYTERHRVQVTLPASMAVVLLHFQAEDCLSLDELTRRTQLPPRDLHSALESLVTLKQVGRESAPPQAGSGLLLGPPRAGRSPSDEYRINLGFDTNYRSLRLSARAQGEKERRAEDDRAAVENQRKMRRYRLEMAIVRCMKTKLTKVSMDDIVNACTAQLSAHFCPTRGEVKKAVDTLIERGYMSREEDANFFAYLP